MAPVKGGHPYLILTVVSFNPSLIMFIVSIVPYNKYTYNADDNCESLGRFPHAH